MGVLGLGRDEIRREGRHGYGGTWKLAKRKIHRYLYTGTEVRTIRYSSSVVCHFASALGG